MVKYVDAKTFEDFNQNQKLMIQTLNHNITKLTDTVVDIKVCLAEVLGGQRILKRIVFWILGIFAILITGGVLSSYMVPA